MGSSAAPAAGMAAIAVPAALAAIVVLGTGAVSWAGTGALIPLLRQAAMLDRPNERSSHSAPTPRGGGAAVVGAILAAWALLDILGAALPGGPAITAGAVLLAAISWLDDRRGLSPLVRLAAQFAAVGIGLVAAVPAASVFQGWLPLPVAIVAAALAWVWFLNLFNFMDGIDGLAGSEAAAIGLGLVLVAAIGAGRDPALAVCAAAIAAAALGFLAWNWAPARIFLGDVGSVPLGYLLGFLLLRAAAAGHWRTALILPLYFLADATITLFRRLARGEKVWRPHRRHFYQIAVQRGLGHAAVVSRVIAADTVLVACGWAAENGWGEGALAAAAVTVAVLLAVLAGLPSLRAGSISAPMPRHEEPPR